MYRLIFIQYPIHPPHYFNQFNVILFTMKSFICIAILFIFTNSMLPPGFITSQLANQRVLSAYNLKKNNIQETLQLNKLDSNTFRILLVAYKSEQILELHGYDSKTSNYKKISTYKICNSSGELGPKNEEGDLQVPEGFYFINKFNPLSKYHLSLGINYPNAADLLRTQAKNPGGEIYIHGDCVTIGCLPMTDDYINEIYIYCALARFNGQDEIPVFIFPFKMTDNNYSHFISQKPNHTSFWRNLKLGYDLFTKNNKPLTISINQNGIYEFKE